MGTNSRQLRASRPVVRRRIVTAASIATLTAAFNYLQLFGGDREIESVQAFVGWIVVGTLVTFVVISAVAALLRDRV